MGGICLNFKAEFFYRFSTGEISHNLMTGAVGGIIRHKNGVSIRKCRKGETSYDRAGPGNL